MSEDQPYFRFYPDAYSHGAFERSNDGCDVCSRPCVWKYAGVIYTAADEPTVCARCIADGRLAEHLGGAFQLHDIFLDECDPRLEDEVLRRTPGVSCFNPFVWPVLDRKPLAFLGYGEEEALIALPEARAAMEAALREVGGRFEGSSPYALVFKEIDGPRYDAVMDLD